MNPKTGARHVHGPITSRQLSPGTWKDFDALFSSHNGVWGGCWCMFFHAPGRFESGAYEVNRRSKRALVESAKAHGTLVYCGEAPVAWCQFGPSEELQRIDRKRGYEPTSPDAWRLTCLFVDRAHRRLGLSGVAVDESLHAMKKLGVRSVESYPVEGVLSASMLWSGTPRLFERHGFKRVARLGKTSWIYSVSLNEWDEPRGLYTTPGDRSPRAA